MFPVTGNILLSCQDAFYLSASPRPCCLCLLQVPRLDERACANKFCQVANSHHSLPCGVGSRLWAIRRCEEGLPGVWQALCGIWLEQSSSHHGTGCTGEEMTHKYLTQGSAAGLLQQNLCPVGLCHALHPQCSSGRTELINEYFLSWEHSI